MNISINAGTAAKFAVLFCAGMLAFSCAPPAGNNPAVTNANLPANAPVANSSPAANSVDQKQLESVALTLPILDALLTDDETAAAIKTESQISDEQLQKLKDAARQAVLKLGERAGEDDYDRSTTESMAAAKKKIDEILGDRGAAFIDVVRRHIAAQGEALAAAQPNAVPNDTRIVVNTPAYRMDVFKDGKLIKTYKVGIGYPEFPLPIGLRKADTIIFNPTWTPPDEPWVKGKFAPGKKVEAGSKDNPLGPLKIPIGLPNLIHGGKAPARLGTFASHGCVGLTNSQVQDFAIVLSDVADSPLTMTEVKAYEKNNTETKKVKFDKPIPVELRYETIVVVDGKLKIYRDVYEKGTNTEDNLRRVLEVYGVSLDSIDPAERAKIIDGLEQMARDAQGNPVDNSNDDDGKKKKPTSAKVTRNAKGKTEIEFTLQELEGKGYPAPISSTPAK